MNGRALERRLGRLVGRRGADSHIPALLVLSPDGWPAADRAAFARDDPAAKAEAVARQTGTRPGPGTALVVFRVRPDGPQ